MTQIIQRHGDAPPSCQHHHIDNTTWQCIACGEQMLSQTVETETVLSAPNLAACTNPACQAALKDGTYDETNPPAGCTNPHGSYIPDPSREREVIIGYKHRYQCERCRTGGYTTYTKDRGVTWGCGLVHKGERTDWEKSS